MTTSGGAAVARGSHQLAAVVGFVLFVMGSALALTTDPLHLGPGIQGEIKSDESVYVAAALSAAYDHDLTFEQRDLDRFEGLYHRGPEGIFLKRGKTLRIHASRAFPFITLVKGPDPRLDRLYFGKALLYPVVAAPFVRLFGLNGLLLLNVWLLGAMVVCGYLFLSARSSPASAVLMSTAFVFASVLPVYIAFFMPEMLNAALVSVAYFLWLHREVAPDGRLRGRWTLMAAAVLLGLATYSKPLNGILVAPLVLLSWWRREWWRGLAAGTAAVAAAAVCFAGTAWISGEFNYQGGDRKTFYGSFPFDPVGDAWNRQPTAIDDPATAAAVVLGSDELPARFARNVEYFVAGRHFGFVPYFFPGAAIIVCWLFSRWRNDAWRILTFLGFAVSVVVMLLILPFTWSGGGGPSGNRYLLGIYPVLLFLAPPVSMPLPAIAAWLGGALFTAKLVLNPFIAAKYPYLGPERGAARWLPVELTMANDLPVMLSTGPIRGRIPYGADPTMLLYFLDQNAFPPEPSGMWVSGGRRADIIVRTEGVIDHLAVSAESPVPTRLTVSMGGTPVVMNLAPNMVVNFDLPASGVRALRSYSYLLSAQSSEGFVPRMHDPESRDSRNLGALLRFRAILKADTPR